MEANPIGAFSAAIENSKLDCELEQLQGLTFMQNVKYNRQS